MRGILDTILPRPVRPASRINRPAPRPATFVRHPAKYWAVLCDLDYFREYADIYGQKIAEDVIVRIGAVLSRTIGDRGPAFSRKDAGFVIVLPGSSLDKARIWTETHRVAIEQLQIPHQGSPLGIVTVSMGLAAMDSIVDHAADQAFEQADVALGRAKRLGSNQVATAPLLAIA